MSNRISSNPQPSAPVGPVGVPANSVHNTDPNNQPAPVQNDPATQPVATDPQQGLDLTPITPTPAPVANDPAPNRVDVGDFGDNGLNIAADYFVNTLGLDINSRELLEAGKGNFHLLEARIEVLGDKAKGATPMLNLAKESIGRVQTQAKAKESATLSAVQSAVGGEENWKQIQMHARSTLSPAQLDEARIAMSHGGIVATAMAQHLRALAEQNPNVTLQGQPVTNGSVPSMPLLGSAPLTTQEFGAQYRELLRKHGDINAAQRSPEYAALVKRPIKK